MELARDYGSLAMEMQYTTRVRCIFGVALQDLHSFELSWLGFAHFIRPNANTAWTQTMGIESTGRWRFLRGAYVDGQLVVGSIALNGADLAAALANLSERITSLEARVPP